MLQVMTLSETAKALVKPGKGILAADESTNTAGKRLASIGMENTEENRRDMREMLFTSEGIEKYISGVILYDETLRQNAKNGRLFVDILKEKGIIPGIKVDLGLEPYEGSDVEQVTKGLEGLDERLQEYYNLGARFAKWRAVYAIKDDLPSEGLYKENAKRLAEYARLCHKNRIVPIVEPEVLMDGECSTHTIERASEVIEKAHLELFSELSKLKVKFDGLLLKPSMVIQGKNCTEKNSVREVAQATLKCFKESVPAEVSGIVFLSGGQTDEEATAHLNAMNEDYREPWRLSFSYGRALQAAALKAWGGKDVEAGQKEFIKRARLNGLASKGRYHPEMEAEE